MSLLKRGIVASRRLFEAKQHAVKSTIVQRWSNRWESTAVNPMAEETMPEMPECNFIPQQYKGPSYEEVVRVRAEQLTPALMTYFKKPLLVHQGHMQWLWDHEGTRYLDMFGGIVTVSVGHCHPKVVNAMETQGRQLWHTTNIYLQPQITEYAKKLTSKLPDNLQVVYFVNSGSEANDLALLMARMYTGKFDILSFRNTYHGGTSNLMGLTAMSNWRFNVPTGFGMQQAMNPDVYRGIWGGHSCRDSPVQTDRQCNCGDGQCMAGDMYAEQLQDVLRHSLPRTGPAAIFVESIQGGGGTVQYPKNFMPQAFDMVHQTGGLCVSDEVQTGFGRTGEHYWGFEAHGVKPDIVTMAKGIGNGFPLAAVVTSHEIASTLTTAQHFNTYGGNPIACAVGSAVLDVIDEEGCQQLSLDVGTYYLQQLQLLRQEFSIVGDVRGKGLMIGIEFVQDKESRRPLDREILSDILEHCKDMGVLFGRGGLYGHVIRIKPPMCITKNDVDFSVAVLRRAIAAKLNS